MMIALILASVAILYCDAANIVFTPFPMALSHHMMLAKVGRELADRGHTVSCQI